MGIAIVCVIVIVVCCFYFKSKANKQTNTYGNYNNYTAQPGVRTDFESLNNAKKAVHLIEAIRDHGKIYVDPGSNGKYYLDFKAILPLECYMLKQYRDADSDELKDAFAAITLKELLGDNYEKVVVEECGYSPRFVMDAITPLTGDWDGERSLLCIPVYCGDSATEKNRAAFIRALGI